MLELQACPDGLSDNSLKVSCEKNDYVSLQLLLKYGANPLKLSDTPLRAAVDIALENKKGI